VVEQLADYKVHALYISYAFVISTIGEENPSETFSPSLTNKLCLTRKRSPDILHYLVFIFAKLWSQSKFSVTFLHDLKLFLTHWQLWIDSLFFEDYLKPLFCSWAAVSLCRWTLAHKRRALLLTEKRSDLQKERWGSLWQAVLNCHIGYFGIVIVFISLLYLFCFFAYKDGRIFELERLAPLLWVRLKILSEQTLLDGKLSDILDPLLEVMLTAYLRSYCHRSDWLKWWVHLWDLRPFDCFLGNWFNGLDTSRSLLNCLQSLDPVPW